MSKFNDGKAKAAGPKSPMTTTGTVTNHAGGDALTRDVRSELFLTAVTNMVGEDTFYESAKDRDDRFSALVRQVAVTDPGWLYLFLGWLRNSANMRSASVVVAAEAIKARLDAGITSTFQVLDVDQMHTIGSKDFIAQAMARADEPGEFLAYWTSKYGSGGPTMGLPKPVKRGLALAVQKLFNEYTYAKYGQADGGFGLGRIVDLVHPAPKAPWQGELFEHALDELHKRDKPIPEHLYMLQERAKFLAMPQAERKAFLERPGASEVLSKAGITWEALSGWLGGELGAKFWESLIPTMGYMALLRNLRNFEKAGISRSARKAVQERLSDPAQVARSRQFPFRFLSAYRAVQSDWWSEALSEALDASVGNLPEFRGRTLILVDTSASMRNKISEKSSVSHADIGALFGVALAKAGAEVDLYGFADGVFGHNLAQGGSVLRGIEAFTDRIGIVGHGTETVKSLKQTYDGHDRVVLVTDMQAFADYGRTSWGGYAMGNRGSSPTVTTAVPAGIPMYGINPSGYASTALDLSMPNRYEIGGFSDQVFRMISLIEAGNAGWPF
jgi:hypothetical protein